MLSIRLLLKGDFKNRNDRDSYYLKLRMFKTKQMVNPVLLY